MSLGEHLPLMGKEHGGRRVYVEGNQNDAVLWRGFFILFFILTRAF